MVKIRRGDLFASNADVIAHGCNCSGGFGSGVAGIVATKYPKARQYYYDQCEVGWNLGDVQFVEQWDGKVIANCATQQEYLPRGVCHADYDAIRSAMMTVKAYVKERGLSVAIPKIGCGLAGGNWDTVRDILVNVFNDYDITVYHL
jgi:O-acetyl-ADP-ribose deacetylase (regulator of RNase III)